MLIFYNPKYSRGSLYGMGLFPFWLYVAFYGKPVYRFSRKKLKFNQFFSLMMSNLLGSAFHVNFFVDGWIDVVPFIISLITMSFVFTFMHKKNHLFAITIFIIGMWLSMSVDYLFY